MARLPVPGSDKSIWGSVLNEYLTVGHNADGSVKATGLQPGAANNPRLNDVWYDAGQDLWKRWNGNDWVVSGAANFVGVAGGAQTLLGWVVVTDPIYGAVGDGVADDTAAIQAAIDAASASGEKVVYLPAGRFVVSGLILPTDLHIRGAGPAATELYLKDGANADVIQGEDFLSLTGTPSSGGIHDFSISHLTVNGNKANNTSGFGLRWYGYNFTVSYVTVKNCAQDGFYSEWSATGQLPAATDQMESMIMSAKFHDNGARGITFFGPHDSVFTAVQVFSNVTEGIYLGGVSDGTYFNQCHVWGEHTTGVVMNSSALVWANSMSEGANGSCITILGNDCAVEGGSVFNGFGAATQIGVQIGDGTHAPAGCRVETQTRLVEDGAIYMANSGGYNRVRLVSYQPNGPYVTGTPHVTDVIDIETANSAEYIPLSKNGYLDRDRLGSNYVRHRARLPDPGGPLVWYRLGTWATANNTGGSRMALTIIGASTYGTSPTDASRSHIVVTKGGDSNGLNIAGYYYSEGGDLVQNVKAVKTGDGNTFDIYAELVGYTGNSSITAEVGTDTYPDTWAWALVGAPDPGAPSGTVAHFQNAYRLTANAVTIGRNTGTTLGFYGEAGGTRPVVTGTTGGNAALQSLIAALDSLGLIDDQTS